ncbi:hypothetical protein B0T26DRAFT_723727 [Lasiosphaeria miniovina]|uniref:Uncharacterized protein n=1 Tax=Lasiosphaeria miniovina TaxID=1954250 RepID=A0AA40A625_9PEZI|nr:uncharacterized protein B0T26DRAFT_723727 [Lasiosphaeria miniovina]KAK0709989.1 hypothetical protein B0T26DRAFT_723727 [Lasiosphaeria miniovina]
MDRSDRARFGSLRRPLILMTRPETDLFCLEQEGLWWWHNRDSLSLFISHLSEKNWDAGNLNHIGLKCTEGVWDRRGRLEAQGHYMVLLLSLFSGTSKMPVPGGHFWKRFWFIYGGVKRAAKAVELDYRNRHVFRMQGGNLVELKKGDDGEHGWLFAGDEADGRADLRALLSCKGNVDRFIRRYDGYADEAPDPREIKNVEGWWPRLGVLVRIPDSL